jgi:hypothetical protein
MNKFVMRTIQAIFYRALIIGINFKNNDIIGAPFFIFEFSDIKQGRSFFFWQIAQKSKNNSVKLLDWIAIHLCPGRDLFIRWQGWQEGALAIGAELPAVIGTGYAIAFYLAPCQRSATMDTGVAQNMRVALRIAKGNKIKAHDLHGQWFGIGDLIA